MELAPIYFIDLTTAEDEIDECCNGRFYDDGDGSTDRRFSGIDSSFYEHNNFPCNVINEVILLDESCDDEAIIISDDEQLEVVGKSPNPGFPKIDIFKTFNQFSEDVILLDSDSDEQDNPGQIRKEVGYQSILKDVKLIVRELVNFVCRKEEFEKIPIRFDIPLNSHKLLPHISRKPYCENEFCRLGCVCCKWKIRRVRCSKAHCIFGCLCEKTTRATKKKSPACERTKNVETAPSELVRSTAEVLSEFGSSLIFDETKRRKRGRPKQSLAQGKLIRASLPVRGSKEVTRKDEMGNGNTGRLRRTRSFDSVKSQEMENESVDSGPPVHALISLVPGLGYIALDEFNSSILKLKDPFTPKTLKKFSSVKDATEWLNVQIRQKMKEDYGDVELKWLVANSAMIESKQIKCFDAASLLNYKITKHGMLLKK